MVFRGEVVFKGKKQSIRRDEKRRGVVHKKMPLGFSRGM